MGREAKPPPADRWEAVRARLDADPARAAIRTALASFGVWAAVPLLVVGLLGSATLRLGARSYIACWLALVAWFLVARTKTLRWSSVVRLFVAGLLLALVAGFVVDRLAALADLDPAESGAAIGIAGTVEELAKLLPVGLLCLLAPGRVRRFTLVDWALVGVASGLAFQAAEDAMRRIAWSVTPLRGPDPWANPLSGYPHFRWSLLSGSADLGGHAVFPGHHVLTAMVALAIGVAVQAGGGPRRRLLTWVLPVAAALVAVSVHMAFTATMANRKLFTSGGSEVPELVRLTWEATARGRLVGPLLLVGVLAALMADATRLRRAEGRLPPHPGGPLPVVPSRTNRLGRALRLDSAGPGPTMFAVTADVAATIGRDAVAIGRSLRRLHGDPPLPDRWAATVEIERRRRELAREDADVGPRRPFVIATLAIGLVGSILVVGFGMRTASDIGRYLVGPGSPSLAGLLDGFSQWWDQLTLLGKLGALLGGTALVAFSAGDFGLVMGPATTRLAGLSPHRAARSAVELAAARLLPTRGADGEVDLPGRLLADPAAFTAAYRPRRRRSPAAEVARVAQVLAGHGVDIDARPSVPDPAGVVPDLLLDGRRFDCVTPRSDDARQLATVLEIRVVRGTASRFVLDLDHTDVDLQVLRRQLDRFPVPGLDEVIVLRGGRALRFFP